MKPCFKTLLKKFTYECEHHEKRVFTKPNKVVRVDTLSNTFLKSISVTLSHASIYITDTEHALFTHYPKEFEAWLKLQQ
jgi:hypothetical protein